MLCLVTEQHFNFLPKQVHKINFMEASATSSSDPNLVELLATFPCHQLCSLAELLPAISGLVILRTVVWSAKILLLVASKSTSFYFCQSIVVELYRILPVIIVGFENQVGLLSVLQHIFQVEASPLLKASLRVALQVDTVKLKSSSYFF